MRKTTLMLLLWFFAISISAQTTIWQDDFESYTDWALSLPGYTHHDNDGLQTYDLTAYNFTNEQYTGTTILFNPSLTTPTSAVGTAWDVHGGAKGVYFITGVPSGPTTANDDWLITPQIDLTTYMGAEFSLWAASILDTWGLEDFEVAVSTTGTDPADFTDVIGTVNDTPLGFNQYTFDLSAYDGQQIYIGIHYISADVYALILDDFLVEEPSLSIEGFEQNVVEHRFNPSTKVLALEAAVVLNTVAVYNMLGQKTLDIAVNNTETDINLSNLQAGIYIVKVNGNNASKTIKLIIN